MQSCIHSMRMNDKSFGGIKERLKKAFKDDSEPLWFPSLVETLADVSWDHLLHSVRITPDSYSTARIIRRDPTASHQIVAYCQPLAGRGGNNGVPIELLSPTIVRQITDCEVQFADAFSLEAPIQRINEALSFLDTVPTIWPVLRRLVRALHIIDSGDANVDVSFSDPALPFSIFVSVPPEGSDLGTMRLAEAILHEAMHLLLTMAARVTPLVVPGGTLYYSPWRGEERDSEGILQALYVFGVIRSFFGVVSAQRCGDAKYYADARMCQIDRQVAEAHAFASCNELTPEGASLVARILYASV